MTLNRREFMKWMAASTGAAAVAGCAGTGGGAIGRVVVIGGGYGGATAARYIKLWEPGIDVALVERGSEFVSCPISNLVLGGNTQIGNITMNYDGLKARGVRLIRDEAVAVDAGSRQVRLASGGTLSYDRLIVSPGIDFMYDGIPGLRSAAAQEAIPHAWKAGPQTLALRRQLTGMRDGGVFVFHIPMAPYRCPPGPYERVCQIADYFKKSKPKSKIIVLDSNPDITSKKGLFLQSWNGVYKGMIDYRPNSELADVDVKGRAVKLTFDSVKGDVLNVVPPHRAGDIAVKAGLITANQRWCGIDWLTMESTAVKGIHVLGDATLSAPAMPKSASMANQHGKICAAAVVAILRDRPVDTNPMIMNACYSFVDGRSAMHVTSIHQYDAGKKTLLPVKGAGGVSPKASELEGTYAWGWAKNIWADTLG
ncbi:MAG: flavocytochrome C [Betaproteobacteria bacterium RIFCSPLOWO2_02_FULL_67_26]|nr:MAG: flavocytochrome C [Betaproteobacteria bacterium RIFCSPLOWO2_02_FULL_67_26]